MVVRSVDALVGWLRHGRLGIRRRLRDRHGQGLAGDFGLFLRPDGGIVFEAGLTGDDDQITDLESALGFDVDLVGIPGLDQLPSGDPDAIGVPGRLERVGLVVVWYTIDRFGISRASGFESSTSSTSTHMPGRSAPNSLTPTTTLIVPA